MLRKSQDLALLLVASESDPKDATSRQTKPTTVRVYERLRGQLGAPMGVDGFRVLASRALALARSESPRLTGVQVGPDGTLHGLSEVESQTDTEENDGSGILFIAQLLGLFLTFLGEATTLRLLEDVRHQAETEAELHTPTEANLNSVEDLGGIASGFEDLLLQVERLKNVSERIQTLSDKYPGMEDGLVTVAGNISSLATVLEVFTLIRSKDVDLPEDEPEPTPIRFLN